MIPTQRRVYITGNSAIYPFLYHRELTNVIPNPTSASPAYINLPNKLVNVYENSTITFKMFAEHTITGARFMFLLKTYTVANDVMLTRKNVFEVLTEFCFDDFEHEMFDFWRSNLVNVPYVWANLDDLPVRYFVDEYGRMAAKQGSNCTDLLLHAFLNNSYQQVAMVGYNPALYDSITWEITCDTVDDVRITLFEILFGPDAYDTDARNAAFYLNSADTDYFRVIALFGTRLKFATAWSIDPYYLMREVFITSNFSNNIYQIDYPVQDMEESSAKDVWTHLWGIIPFNVDENSKNLSLNYSGEQLINSFNLNCFQNVQLRELELEFWRRCTDGSFIAYPFISKEISMIIDFR